MALRHESERVGDRRRSPTAKKESAFRTHLAVYLGVGLFLFTLNLLTSPFHLWFYWPLFFWGWGLVFHAVATYGADAPTRVPDVLRSLVPWVSKAQPVTSSPAGRETSAAPFAAEAFAAAHERIERLKEIAWQLPDGPVRDLAERLSADAERIVAAMARDRADAESVERFDVELLIPTASLLDRCAHAIALDPAADTPSHIAEHDLPRVQARFAAMLDQMEGGAVEVGVAGRGFGGEPLTPSRVPLRSHP